MNNVISKLPDRPTLAKPKNIWPFIISHLFAGPIVLFAICLFLIFIDDPKTIDTSIILKTLFYVGGYYFYFHFIIILLSLVMKEYFRSTIMKTKAKFRNLCIALLIISVVLILISPVAFGLILGIANIILTLAFVLCLPFLFAKSKKEKIDYDKL